MTKKNSTGFPDLKLVKSDEPEYAVMVMEIYRHFRPEFQPAADEVSLMGFCAEVWNLACLYPLVTTEMFEEFTSPLEMSADLRSLSDRMIRFKIERFPASLRLIRDYDVDPYNHNLIVHETYSAAEAMMGVAADLDSPLNYFNYYDDEDDFEPELIEGQVDRLAIILLPRQPMIDWMKKHRPGSAEAFLRQPYVYLIDDVDCDPALEIDSRWDYYWSLTLAQTKDDARGWPRKRTYSLFREWFEVRFSDFVYDTYAEPLMKE